MESPQRDGTGLRLFRLSPRGAIATAQLLSLGLVLLTYKLAFPGLVNVSTLTSQQLRLLGVLEILMMCLAFPVGWLSVLGAGVSDPPLAAVVFVPLNGYFWGFLLEWLYRVWQQSRRQKRQQLGLCLQCGYDLRASMDRCPECGSPIREEVTSEQPQ